MSKSWKDYEEVVKYLTNIYKSWTSNEQVVKKFLTINEKFVCKVQGGIISLASWQDFFHNQNFTRDSVNFNNSL